MRRKDRENIAHKCIRENIYDLHGRDYYWLRKRNCSDPFGIGHFGTNLTYIDIKKETDIKYIRRCARIIVGSVPHFVNLYDYQEFMDLMKPKWTDEFSYEERLDEWDEWNDSRERGRAEKLFYSAFENCLKPFDMLDHITNKKVQDALGTTYLVLTVPIWLAFVTIKSMEDVTNPERHLHSLVEHKIRKHRNKMFKETKEIKKEIKKVKRDMERAQRKKEKRNQK